MLVSFSRRPVFNLQLGYQTPLPRDPMSEVDYPLSQVVQKLVLDGHESLLGVIKSGGGVASS